MFERKSKAITARNTRRPLRDTTNIIPRKTAKGKSPDFPPSLKNNTNEKLVLKSISVTRKKRSKVDSSYPMKKLKIALTRLEDQDCDSTNKNNLKSSAKQNSSGKALTLDKRLVVRIIGMPQVLLSTCPIPDNKKAIVEDKCIENNEPLECLHNLTETEKSTKEQGNVKLRVPIYKTQLTDKKPSQNKKDEYEFDEFSPKTGKFSKRVNRSSGFFEKNIHEELKKIEGVNLKKAKAQKRTVKRHVPQSALKVKPYSKRVDDILLNIIKKVQNKKNKENVPKSPNNQHIVPIIVPLNNQDIFSHNKPTSSSNSNFKENQAVSAQVHTITALVHKSSFEERPSLTKDALLMPKRTLSKENHNEDLNSTEQISIFCHENEDHLSDIDCGSDTVSNCDPDDPVVNEDDVENCFGFDIDENKSPIGTPLKNSNRINIISNITVNPNRSSESPASFNYHRPNANSTMLQSNNTIRPKSPWRLDCRSFKKNPHYVSLKNNALPRIDQDMVLDHTLVEEFENSCSKTPGKKTNYNKSPVQKTILDYIDNNIERENIPMQGSLFDNDSFISPIKKGRNTNEKIARVKRNVLGVRNDNIITTSFSNVDLDLADSSHITYFGFDVSSEEVAVKLDEKENFKPSRFSFGQFRQYMSKKKLKKQEETKESKENVTFDIIPEAEDLESNHNPVNIFEEPEDILDNMPAEIGTHKRHRRKRTYSVDSDTSDIEEKQKKKRHKKTKFELEQEKWIQSFNNELEDVEKFELEIE